MARQRANEKRRRSYTTQTESESGTDSSSNVAGWGFRQIFVFLNTLMCFFFVLFYLVVASPPLSRARKPKNGIVGFFIFVRIPLLFVRTSRYQHVLGGSKKFRTVEAMRKLVVHTRDLSITHRWQT